MYTASSVGSVVSSPRSRPSGRHTEPVPGLSPAGSRRIVSRLDDLVAGQALLFPPPQRVLTAHSADEVLPLLRQVDRASAAGCWAAGYLAYEAAAAFLPVSGPAAALPAASAASRPAPLAWFALSDEPSRVPALQGLSRGGYTTGDWSVDWSEQRHAAAVAQVHDAIAAGTTYQANLTTRLRGRLRGDAQAWYRDLAVSQSGAFNAYLDLGESAVVSASPERFFRWTDTELLCSPMKGTRPRGSTPESDQQLAQELRDSAKDRAENVMIVDLLRNDLARIAEPGSVHVRELLRLEQYPTVWQLTSDIVARPQPELTLQRALAALFPCGSITGAPKLSTTRLLEQVEVAPRGIYCGAIGYLAPPGAPVRAEFSVAIRTCTIGPAELTADPTGSRRVDYGVGGGVTASSTAPQEYAELLAKTAVVTDRPPAPFRLLETFRSDAGDSTRQLHLRRLLASAAYFGFTVDAAALDGELAQALRDSGSRRVRLLLARDGTLEVELSELPAPDRSPLRVAVDTARPVEAASVWLRHKTTRRQTYTAASARHPQADEVLLVNTDGNVTEATTANLLVCLDNRWYTPPLSDGCLPGVARAQLLASGGVAERSITPDELRRAQRIELVNSLRGSRSVTLLSEQQ